MSESQLEVLDGIINTLLQKDVIKESAHENGEYISPIFLRQKPDGTHRLILNLKILNQYTEYKHFKIENIYSVLRLVRRNSFFTKIDLKDAYYSIPVDNQFQNFLKFTHRDKLYQFSCLPNGYSQGPRKFTKLMKAPLSYLRQMLMIIAAYLDDLINMNLNKQKCYKA